MLGFGILMLGDGLQSTLLGVRASLEGFPTAVTGLIMSTFYVGFLAGALYAPRIVERVGHIRVFGALASLASAAVLIRGVVITPVAWSLLRLLRGPRPRDGALLGLGLVILAASRPYEGLVASLPAAVVLLVWAVRQIRSGRGRALAPAGLALVAVLGVGAGGLGYYQYRVTGSPFRMPYLVYDAASQSVAPLVWSPVEVAASDGLAEGGEPEPGGPAHRAGWRWLVKDYPRRFEWLWNFYLGPALTLPLLCLPWRLRDRRVAFALGTCALVVAANLVTVAGFPHYYAPVAPLVLALAVLGLRCLYAWRRPRGRVLAWGVVATVMLTLLAAFGMHARNAGRGKEGDPWFRNRAHIQDELCRREGQHLVIVSRKPGERSRASLRRWVHNGADLDGAKVVWAHDLGLSRNQALIQHFPRRRVWLLSTDVRPPRLNEVSVGGQQR
ncbi:MAG: hypothetical protein IH608_03280 [Proteobacteria bacterium]|nr:hypothetical protein [Pseudomonadota bacterium]